MIEPITQIKAPITVEQAWANGFNFSLTLPYAEHEYHLIGPALASLNKGGRAWALVEVKNSDGEGIEIWLKGGKQ